MTVEKIEAMICGNFEGAHLLKKKSQSNSGHIKFCQDKSGKVFVVKNSMPEHWKINEFIAGNLAKHFLNQDTVADIFLKKEKKGDFRKFIKIAIQPNLTELNVWEDNKLEYFTNGYNVKIVNNKLKFIRTYNSKKVTTVNGKAVQGLYDSFLFSLWVDDRDNFEGHNFALVKKNNEQFFITRIDFDDSLKFFETAKYAKNKYQSIYEQLIEGYVLPYKSLDKKKMVESIKDFFIKLSSLPELLDNAYKIIAEVYSDKELSNIFNPIILNCNNPEHELPSVLEQLTFRELQNYCQVNPAALVVDQIKGFTTYMLSRRAQDLKQIKICFEIDLAKSINEKYEILKENMISKLNSEEIYSFENGNPFICYSDSKEKFRFVDEEYLLQSNKVDKEYSFFDPLKDLADIINLSLIDPLITILFGSTEDKYEELL